MTTCITDDALAAWAEGKATDAAVAAMNAHVASCDTCRVVLAEVTRTSGERPEAPTLGRYQLQEKVGAGGMGTVWAAWDPTVGRRVALKVLHEAASDTSHRAQRFHLERQVLAGLEHPNIARLLDAGETTEGRPWFAMDFVDGQPLDQFCDAQKLDTRQRLALLLPVLDAVSYAHQHLVVHRDLKPTNILVGHDGAPRLVDFGIARLLEQDGALTQTGMTPMTPAYASPEQVKREAATTSSDVYSLGVVMFELLTGVSPYETAPGQLDALLAAVREAEPKPLSLALARATDAQVATRAPSRERLRRALADDVDAIVLMALRKEPKDRYPSVQALADDVRAALEGRPTLARRGDTAYRAVRFMRRHAVGLTALVATFVALTVGLVATLWQARRAAQERDTAQRRFTQVRSLAHSVLFDYHDGIADLAGSTEVREKMVKDAQVYLDALATEVKDDLSLRRELAQGFLKLGDVQGDPFGASLGDLVSAKASYLRARELAESVLQTDPTDWDARRVVSSSHEKVGAVLEVSGDFDGALAEYDVAWKLDSALSAERPEDLDQRLQAARDDLSAGQVLLQKGEGAGASVRLERALEGRKYVLERRNNPVTRRAVGAVLISLSDVRQEQGRMAEAIAAAEEAERIFAKLVEEQPDSVLAQRSVARAWAGLAGLYRLTLQKDRAIEVARKSLAQARAAVGADPTNVVARRDLAVSLGNLGMALSSADKYEELEVVEKEALEVTHALIADMPDNVQHRRDLISLLATAVPGNIERGEFDLAEARLRELIEVAAWASKANPDDMTLKEEGVMAHHGLCALRTAQKRFDDAFAENRIVIAGLEEILAGAPTLSRLRVRWAISKSIEGELRVRQAEIAPAAKRKEAWKVAKTALDAAMEASLQAEEPSPIGQLMTTREEVKKHLARVEGELAKLAKR
jgi:non-specific serine/threonine protein kinase/serine/threonine-protein kinase